MKLVVPEANTIDVVYVDTVDDATETAEGVASDAWYKDPSDLGWSHEGLEFAGWTMTEQDDGFYLGEGDLKDMSDTTVRVYAQWREAAENPDNPGTNPGNPGGGTTDPDNPGTEDPVAKTHKVTFDDCLPSTENQVVEVKTASPSPSRPIPSARGGSSRAGTPTPTSRRLGTSTRP